jgi:hypothetical protein
MVYRNLSDLCFSYTQVSEANVQLAEFRKAGWNQEEPFVYLSNPPLPFWKGKALLDIDPALLVPNYFSGKVTINQISFLS